MSPPSTTPSTTPGLQRAPLDVYKKITIVRNSGDSVVYEDSNGNEQRISDLGNAALAVVSALSIIYLCFFYYCLAFVIFFKNLKNG